MENSSVVYFGGPDKEKHTLRDTLLKHIQNVPANGKIYWMCYYFNEPILFDALIAASNRGVEIKLIIEGNPRSSEVNVSCFKVLSEQTNISIAIKTSKPFWRYLGIHWHGHMHAKMYYFSHPNPCVLIGSYNPTSDPHDINSHLIDQIGDHTISHNVLVKTHENVVTSNLIKHFCKIYDSTGYLRFSRLNNLTHTSSEWHINFLPRYKSHSVSHLLSSKDKNVLIKCAISHLKGPAILDPLIKASRSEKIIEIIIGASKRRINQNTLTKLEQHKIKYRLITTDNHKLMHSKFIIYQSNKEYCVLFGSFNWSSRSWWLNNEIIACCRDEAVIRAFEQRWNEMLAMA